MEINMPRLALYPGSFDPITNGHLDIIVRGLAIFDSLVVGIGENIAKQPLFSVEERVEMVRDALGEIPNVEVISYSGLTAKFAEQIGASAILRGLRAISDFEFEFQMTLANRKLFPKAETVFLMPCLSNVFLNSSMVKDIVSMGGDVELFVPPGVVERLKIKFGGA